MRSRSNDKRKDNGFQIDLTEELIAILEPTWKHIYYDAQKDCISIGPEAPLTKKGFGPYRWVDSETKEPQSGEVVYYLGTL